MKLPVCTPYGEYASQLDFDRAGVINSRFVDRKKHLPHLYYLKHEGPGVATYENVVYTPWGVFKHQGNSHSPGGVKQAFAQACAQGDEFAQGYKDMQSWWTRCKKLWPEKYYVKRETRREWL